MQNDWVVSCCDEDNLMRLMKLTSLCADRGPMLHFPSQAVRLPRTKWTTKEITAKTTRM